MRGTAQWARGWVRPGCREDASGTSVSEVGQGFEGPGAGQKGLLSRQGGDKWAVVVRGWLGVRGDVHLSPHIFRQIPWD